MDPRIACRLRSNIVKGGLDGHQDLIAQPGALALVPQERCFDIRGSRRTEDDSHPRLRLLLPWNADWALSIELLESAVEILALCIRKRDGLPAPHGEAGVGPS